MISHTHASSFNLTPIVSLPFAGIGGNRVFRFRSCWPGLLSFLPQEKNGLFFSLLFASLFIQNSILLLLFRLGAAKIRLFFEIIKNISSKTCYTAFCSSPGLCFFIWKYVKIGGFPAAVAGSMDNGCGLSDADSAYCLLAYRSVKRIIAPFSPAF